MTTLARRRLTLDAYHERLIHALCVQAQSAVWALTFGNKENQKRAASELTAAWKAVDHEVMP